MPFEVPESWEWVKIKDIFEINPKNSLDDEVDVSFIPMTLISDGFSNNHNSEIRKWKEIKKGFTHFQQGDVAVAKITPCFENRKSVILNNLKNNCGAGTTELHILRPIFELSISNYTLYFIKTEFFIDQGISHFSGAVGQQRVGKNVIEETWFPLPPLAEQKRIVGEIERLFTFIDTIEVNKLSLEQLILQTKSKVLNLAIHGKLVPQNPDDEPASALLERIIKEQKSKKTTSDKFPYPFEVPTSWAWTKFSEIVQHNSGKTLDKSRNTGQMREYITTSNLYWGRFDFSELRSMLIEENELSKCTAVKGDLLICEGGDAGRSAIWDSDHPICFQNHIHRVRPFGGIATLYLYYYMLHIYLNRDIKQYLKGVGIQSLSGSSLSSITIPLPPLAEQHRIVKKIEEISDVLNQMQENLQENA